MTYELYCSQPAGGDQGILASLWGALKLSIFCTLWFYPAKYFNFNFNFNLPLQPQPLTQHTQTHAHRVPRPREQVLPAVARSHLQVGPAVPAVGGCGPRDPWHTNIGKG